MVLSANTLDRYNTFNKNIIRLHSTIRSFLRYSNFNFNEEPFLSLILSFSISLKYHLRDVNGLNFNDLCLLLPDDYLSSLKKSSQYSKVRFNSSPLPSTPPSRTSSLMSLNNLNNSQSNIRTVTRSYENVSYLSPPDVVNDNTQNQNQSNSSPTNTSSSIPKSALSNTVPRNVPLSITRLLQVYLDFLIDSQQFIIYNNLNNYINDLTLHLTNFENLKIRNTQINLIIYDQFNNLLTLYLVLISINILNSFKLLNALMIITILSITLIKFNDILNEYSKPMYLNDLDNVCLEILKESNDFGGNVSIVSRNTLGDKLTNAPSSSFRPSPVRGSDWYPDK